MEEAADREVAQALGRETELVTHLHRTERNPPRVLFRVLVFLGERCEQRAHLRPEKRLHLDHEVGSPEIAEQRTRSCRAVPQVERDGNPHERDADHLEDVPEPPAELPVAEQ